jgi:hypothetical protein
MMSLCMLDLLILLMSSKLEMCKKSLKMMEKSSTLEHLRLLKTRKLSISYLIMAKTGRMSFLIT